MARKRAFIAPVVTLLFLASLVTACAVRNAGASEQSTKVAFEPRDEWHLLYMGGNPAGYIRFSVRELAEEDANAPGYRATMTQKIVLKRDQAKIEIETHSSVDEDPAGNVTAFEMLQKQSNLPVQTDGVREGDDFVVSERVGAGTPIKRRLPIPQGTVGFVRAERELKSGLKNPGDQLKLLIFVPELQKALSQTAVLGHFEEVELRNSRQKLRRIDVNQEGIRTAEWVDGDFNMVRSQTPMMGLSIVTYLSTREEVLGYDFSSPPEVFVSTFIRVNRRVSASSDKATYRLTLNENDVALAATDANANKDTAKLFETAGQTIVKRIPPQTIDLRVERVSMENPAQRPLKKTPELAEYLASNTYVQTEDPKIARAARNVVGDEQNAWRAAQALSKWVYENVTEKNLQTAFATAKEVMETRQGDCTEHAVLLAALARAEGIPSRVVAGIVYYQKAFVGHMWTEVYVGKWVPLDATRSDPRVGADHIAFSVSSLDSGSLAELFLSLVQVIGNLSVDVREVE